MTNSFLMKIPTNLDKYVCVGLSSVAVYIVYHDSVLNITLNTFSIMFAVYFSMTDNNSVVFTKLMYVLYYNNYIAFSFHNSIIT